MDIVVSLIKIYIEMAHLGYTAMTSFVDLAIDLLCGAFKLWVKEIDVPVFTRERRPFLLLSLSIVPLSEGSTVQSQSEMAICNSKVVKRTSRRFNGIWMSLAEVTGRKEGTLSLLPLCRDRDVGVRRVCRVVRVTEFIGARKRANFDGRISRTSRILLFKLTRIRCN